VGGGTIVLILDAEPRQGPSPRGRGNLAKDTMPSTPPRTIPAWAGEPSDAIPGNAFGKDHPRVGGGTPTCGSIRTADGGPSPRGRGNLITLGLGSIFNRTIPAWAGEPWPSLPFPTPPTDHPRVGGGTLREARRSAGRPGPSPRGRGNRNGAATAGDRVRTIPAWAGEPGAVLCRERRRQDHPRVGGGTRNGV